MPSHHLPLLLTAYQYRFGRDLDAMSWHLIDTVAIAWDELGTDLLDGAPEALLTALTGGEHWPSTHLDNLITPDGSPPTRITVTDETAAGQDMQWGYVLYPSGIEVISLMMAETRGPLVCWDTDPRTRFSDHPGRWKPSRQASATAPAQSRQVHVVPIGPTTVPAPAARSTRR
ncbi:hypothetical protein [Streptomyces sp. NPDC056244]|uniref:hypothetical protein n=1 Tax=Streptomyces sp. NPDC056244 TaxID=3345762 RepID=UPI0035DF3813